MIPKFRAWHNELGRMMLVKAMLFFANELEELELSVLLIISSMWRTINEGICC